MNYNLNIWLQKKTASKKEAVFFIFQKLEN